MQVRLDLVDPAAQEAAGPGAAVPPADVRLFDSLMNQAGGAGPVEALTEATESLSAKVQAWREDWLGFGERIDVSDHRTVVRMLDQQAKLTGQSLRFQFTLQTAESMRHGFKTLYQQQA